MRYPVITIDGPSGAGKGTVCMRLANTLGYQLLDSGALYRIVGLKAQQAGLLNKASGINGNNGNNNDTAKDFTVIPEDLDEAAIAKLTQALDIKFIPRQLKDSESAGVDIVVDGIEVGQQIRNEVVGNYASKVATLPKVREALLDLQKNMANNAGLVADGRDMGTVVFPDADAKIFLTASAEARAQRRVEQLHGTGEPANYEQILATIQERDERDQNRQASPSRPAADALVIDSSDMSADSVYKKVKHYCMQQGISFSNS